MKEEAALHVNQLLTHLLLCTHMHPHINIFSIDMHVSRRHGGAVKGVLCYCTSCSGECSGVQIANSPSCTTVVAIGVRRAASRILMSVIHRGEEEGPPQSTSSSLPFWAWTRADFATLLHTSVVTPLDVVPCGPTGQIA